MHLSPWLIDPRSDFGACRSKYVSMEVYDHSTMCNYNCSTMVQPGAHAGAKKSPNLQRPGAGTRPAALPERLAARATQQGSAAV